MTVGENNVLYELLVPRDKIIFPPLHIKLELMKQLVKAIKKVRALNTYVKNFLVRPLKSSKTVYSTAQISENL